MSPAAATPGAAAYTRACRAAAAEVLAAYSTSFSVAVRTLPADVRAHITAIYAMARIADEIVDGGLPGDPARARSELDAFAARIAQAAAAGGSADVIAHAFAVTAGKVGITAAEWDPFFASMRADLQPRAHTAASVAAYIHGSAEVIGHMCVRAFFLGAVPEASAGEIFTGAEALGAAFQKVNFLRALADDTTRLERRYFPGIDPQGFSDADRDRIIAEITADLARADAAIGLLPARVRPGVRIAHRLFAELTRTLAQTPAAEIRTRRVRVPGTRKLLVAARALTPALSPAGPGSSDQRPGSAGPRPGSAERAG